MSDLSTSQDDGGSYPSHSQESTVLILFSRKSSGLARLNGIPVSGSEADDKECFPRERTHEHELEHILHFALSCTNHSGACSVASDKTIGTTKPTNFDLVRMALLARIIETDALFERVATLGPQFRRQFGRWRKRAGDIKAAPQMIPMLISRTLLSFSVTALEPSAGLPTLESWSSP